MKQLIDLNAEELAEMVPVRAQLDVLNMRMAQIMRLAERRSHIDPDAVKGVEPKAMTPMGQDWSGFWAELPDQAPGNPAAVIEIPLPAPPQPAT
jgi:hypothetical protein